MIVFLRKRYDMLFLLKIKNVWLLILTISLFVSLVSSIFFPTVEWITFWKEISFDISITYLVLEILIKKIIEIKEKKEEEKKK